MADNYIVINVHTTCKYNVIYEDRPENKVIFKEKNRKVHVFHKTCRDCTAVI